MLYKLKSNHYEKTVLCMAIGIAVFSAFPSCSPGDEYVKVGDEYIYDYNPVYFQPFRASLYLPKLEKMSFSTGGYYKETDRCYNNGLCKITATSTRYPVETCGVCYGKSSNPTVEENDMIKGEVDKEGYMRIYIGD